MSSTTKNTQEPAYTPTVIPLKTPQAITSRFGDGDQNETRLLKPKNEKLGHDSTQWMGVIVHLQNKRPDD